MDDDRRKEFISDDNDDEEYKKDLQRQHKHDEEEYKESMKEVRKHISNFKPCDKCGMDPKKLLEYVDAMERLHKTCTIL